MIPIRFCWGGPIVQAPRVSRHQRGLPTHMTDAGESLRDPCVLSGTGGSPRPIFNFGSAGGVANVAPACRTISGRGQIALVLIWTNPGFPSSGLDQFKGCCEPSKS
ncbi:hypothetical protein E2C01_009570 [Portunus trituberculatus]|uniref:Uncharacterized protein n=1 Tax=Portunus trituberculatus TaxID=210409 RepID=A0A5B7D654_PORTR|nr:hypothetical protein [Portunus trituberculatus]